MCICDFLTPEQKQLFVRIFEDLCKQTQDDPNWIPRILTDNESVYTARNKRLQIEEGSLSQKPNQKHAGGFLFYDFHKRTTVMLWGRPQTLQH